ncbi:MAG: GNAT family N-acetyltransferase [Candidatus Aenigmatarchaeota archaeon]
MAECDVKIRRATADDAKGVTDVIAAIVDEDKYTVMRKFSEADEREYILGLSHREKIFVADAAGKIVGMQSLTLEHKYSDKMAHVATMGTWIIDGYRRMGIGSMLASESIRFAKEQGYEKVVIEVIEDNGPALGYYSKLGFEKAGLLRRQVKLHGEYRDHVVMELFL